MSLHCQFKLRKNGDGLSRGLQIKPILTIESPAIYRSCMLIKCYKGNRKTTSFKRPGAKDKNDRS